MAKAFLFALAQLLFSTMMSAAVHVPPHQLFTNSRLGPGVAPEGQLPGFGTPHSPFPERDQSPPTERGGVNANPARKPRLLDDFYTSINYDWMATAKAPAGTFETMDDEIWAQCRKIMNETASKRLAKKRCTRNEQRVGDMYLSGIDINARKKDGLRRLKGVFDAIQTVKNKGELAGMLARKGIDTFFDAQMFPVIFSTSTPKNMLYISPNLNTLVPSYLGDDLLLKNCTENRNVCDQVLAALVDVFTKAGDASQAQQSAVHVYSAVVAMLPPEKYDVVDFNSTYFPGFDIYAYLNATGVSSSRVLLYVPDFFPLLGKWLTNAPEAQIRAFMQWKVFLATKPYLASDLSKAVMNLTDPTRATRTPEFTVEYYMILDPLQIVGMALGQIYQQQVFPPATNKTVVALAERLRSHLRGVIQNLSWMEPATKVEAQKKVDAFRFVIGSPTEELFAGLTITRRSYLGNGLQAMEYNRQLQLNLLKKSDVSPYDERNLPQTLNAYYYPVYNSIFLFPGLLRPPYFSPNATDEINFAGMGMVISHEMTHAFDNTGRLIDYEGVLRNWWTANDEADFAKFSDTLVRQFNSYSVLGKPVNGQKTLGENIADLGGVAIAFGAWNKSRTAGGLPLAHEVTRKSVPASLKTFSPEQRFFVSYAEAWRTVDTPEFAMYLLAVDVHSPNKFRVNGPLSNLEAFYSAFKLKRGFKMYRKPSDRVTMWG